MDTFFEHILKLIRTKIYLFLFTYFAFLMKGKNKTVAEMSKPLQLT